MPEAALLHWHRLPVVVANVAHGGNGHHALCQASHEPRAEVVAAARRNQRQRRRRRPGNNKGAQLTEALKEGGEHDRAVAAAAAAVEAQGLVA